MNRVWSIFFIEEGRWGKRERERVRQREPSVLAGTNHDNTEPRRNATMAPRYLARHISKTNRASLETWRVYSIARCPRGAVEGGSGGIYTGPVVESAAGPRRPIVCPWVINFRLIEIWCKRRRIVHSLYAEICVAGFEFRRLPLCRGINCPFVYLPGLCNRLLATLDTQ